MQRNKDYPIKNTLEVFKRLRIEKNLLSKKQKNFLESKGYLIIKPTNFMKKNLKKLNLAAKKLIEKEGKRGGNWESWHYIPQMMICWWWSAYNSLRKFLQKFLQIIYVKNVTLNVLN